MIAEFRAFGNDLLAEAQRIPSTETAASQQEGLEFLQEYVDRAGNGDAGETVTCEGRVLRRTPPPAEEGELLVVAADGKGVPMRRTLQQRLEAEREAVAEPAGVSERESSSEKARGESVTRSVLVRSTSGSGAR